MYLAGLETASSGAAQSGVPFFVINGVPDTSGQMMADALGVICANYYGRTQIAACARS